MKKIIGIFAIIVWVSTGIQANVLQNNPTLSVMAKSGLKLRVEPSLNAPTLDVIPYGEDVTISTDYVPKKEKLNINWVEGNWVKVKFKEHEGFVFDGFLSPLNVPLNNTEFSPNIDGLSYSMYSWVFHNYKLNKIDTIMEHSTAQLVSYDFDTCQMEVYESTGVYRLTWIIDDVRIMDAYHLLESMLDTRSMRSIYKANSTFYTGVDGRVEKIKVGNELIEIKLIDGDKVAVVCKSTIEGC